MPKQIFEVIQRLEVEDGIPRVISSAINLLEGGVDLLSQARAKLEELSFTDKYEENKTAQYIGYRLKHPRKGVRRYSLVLFQRKDGLLISFPQKLLNPFLLVLEFKGIDPSSVEVGSEEVKSTLRKSYYWVRPSKEDLFLEASQAYKNVLQGEVSGTFNLDPEGFDPASLLDCEKSGLSRKEVSNLYFWNHSEYLKQIWEFRFCLTANHDPLFPYCYQFFVWSSDELDELLTYFIPRLMEFSYDS